MRLALLAFLLGTLGGLTAEAHHSISAVYDRSHSVSLRGTIVEFALVQPHPFVVIATREEGREQRWRGELDNRHELVAIGVTASTLKPGDEVVVSGSASRNQQHQLYVLRLDRPGDGFWYEQVGASPRIGTR
jgi:hypothetical protein